MKLYELGEQYLKVWELVSDDADLQLLQDTLEGLEGDIESKVEGTIKLIKSIEADEAGIKVEEERLYNRRKALENRRESIKKYLEGNLLAMGIDKVKTPLFTATIQNNPPSVKIVNEHLINSMYFNIPAPVIDKKLILLELKAGLTVEGVELQQTKSLRIR